MEKIRKKSLQKRGSKREQGASKREQDKNRKRERAKIKVKE